MSGFVVERAGLLTTVQDAGRWGWQHLGVSISGWMDDWSARLANRLLANEDGAATLEVTLTGPTLRAERDLVVAVTGAVFDVTIGGRHLRSPCVAPLSAGDTLAFGVRHRGARAYVACAGGLVGDSILGSRSSDLRAGLGGAQLRRGDRCAVGTSAVRSSLPRELEAPDWLFEDRVHVLAGPDEAAWTAAALSALCEASAAVSTASDRTGYRLERVTVPSPSGTLLSTPVAAGTVQVPPSGNPILLMADCQTTGGYARVGAIASADRAVAGQLGPGDRVRFVEVTFDLAANLAVERNQHLEQMVESAR